MQLIWRILTDPVKSLGIWCLFVVGLLIVGVFAVGQKPFEWFSEGLSTDLMELLPVTEQDKGVSEASDRFARNFSDQVIFIVSAAGRDSARLAGLELDTAFKQRDIFEQLNTRVDLEKWQKSAAFYYPYRYALLSQNELNLSSDQLTDRLIGRAFNQFASPVGLANSRQLIEDPLSQTSLWFESLSTGRGKLQNDEGMLVIKQDDQYHVMITGILKGASMSLSSQSSQISLINSAIQDVVSRHNNIEIISSGMIFHAKAGADAAQKEVSTIGVGSLAGVILLIVLTFRSFSPLLLCLLSIGCGVLSGYLVTLWVFGKVHVMTLVFGASLIGISIDYAFHYLAEWLRQGKAWVPVSGLKHVLPGITLGLLTSLMGYFPMLATPFPGLQQMAVFSSAGLVAAWLSVVLVYPALMKKPGNVTHDKIWLLSVVNKILAVYSGIRKQWVIAIALVLASGIFWLETNDDIRQLQSRSSALVDADQTIRTLMDTRIDNRFLLVQGRTQEEMLQVSEQLSAMLNIQIDKGLLTNYQSISKLVPSRERQQQNYRMITNLFDSALPEMWANIGFSGEASDKAREVFAEAEDRYITPEQWLQSPVADFYRHLWLGQIEGRYFSAVMLQGVSEQWDPQSLPEIAGVSFIDKTTSTSSLFGRYRVLMGWLLVIAYSAITGLLALRYGIRGAINVITPPAISVLLTLSLLGYLGEPLNLFHVLALIMVLGIGIDYTLFFHEAKNEYKFTYVAITLSAITTILSFGLLALSSTDAIRGFGLTVLLGIGFCYLLSPLAIRNTPHD